jgi:hypothetical protein
LFGICAAGIEHCLSGGLECVQTNAPAPETCNNLDDNCDGTIDTITQGCSTACGSGVETCVGGAWVGCTAPMPQPEVCNSVDDNCNGTIDDGFNLASDPNNCGSCNNVCNLSHTNVNGCSGYACYPVTCDSGWVNQDGTNSNGCECADDTDEAIGGDTCGGAINKGTLGEGSSVTISGKIATPGDEDWYQVTFTDNTDTLWAADPFRPNITFQSNPGSAYRFQVWNSDCTVNSVCGTTNLSDFKYYSGPGTNHACGEGSVPGWDDCQNQSRSVRIRVIRTAGGTACDTYSLLVKNGP